MNSPDMATSGSEDCSQPKKAPVISEPYECPLCQESCTSLLSILQHIKSHNRDNPWSCQGCEIALDEGVLHPHNDKCPASWNDSDDSWEDTDGNTSSKCTLCPFTSDDLCTLLDHIQLHVRKRRDASEFMSDDENKTYRNKDKTYRDNIYNCTECEFYCVCPDKLAAHMQLHIPGAALECKNCEVTFQSLSELRKHKKSHDVARPFGCPKCPARFTRADNMKIHLQHHNGEAQFSCRFCRYMTNSRVRLTTHYRHHQKAGYKSAASTKASGTCPVCSKGFISYPLLLFHIKAHCVSPPFRCPSCQKLLGSSDKALEHFLSHIESVTLSCAYCNFKCFEDSTIHHHLGTQHGSEKPFQCELCNYRFGSFQHWKRHQLVHSGEKPYVCDICGTRFCASGNRKAHMIKLHGHYIPLPRGKRCKAKEASATKKNEASTTKPIIDIEYEEN